MPMPSTEKRSRARSKADCRASCDQSAYFVRGSLARSICARCFTAIFRDHLTMHRRRSDRSRRIGRSLSHGRNSSCDPNLIRDRSGSHGAPDRYCVAARAGERTVAHSCAGDRCRPDGPDSRGSSRAVRRSDRESWNLHARCLDEASDERGRCCDRVALGRAVRVQVAPGRAVRARGHRDVQQPAR